MNFAHKFSQSQSLTYENSSPETAVNAGQSAQKISVKEPMDMAFENRSKNRSNDFKTPQVNASQTIPNHKSILVNKKYSLSFAHVSSDPAISDLCEPMKRRNDCVMMPPSDVTFSVFMWLMRLNFLAQADLYFLCSWGSTLKIIFFLVQIKFVQGLVGSQRVRRDSQRRELLPELPNLNKWCLHGNV